MLLQAWSIATEWELQGERLRPDTMPLMKLATTSIDQVHEIRPLMVDSMLRCLQSDLACFRSDETALAVKVRQCDILPLPRPTPYLHLYVSVPVSAPGPTPAHTLPTAAVPSPTTELLLLRAHVPSQEERHFSPLLKWTFTQCNTFIYTYTYTHTNMYTYT